MALTWTFVSSDVKSLGKRLGARPLAAYPHNMVKVLKRAKAGLSHKTSGDKLPASMDPSATLSPQAVAMLKGPDRPRRTRDRSRHFSVK
jgi:hypothetical protein